MDIFGNIFSYLFKVNNLKDVPEEVKKERVFFFEICT